MYDDFGFDHPQPQAYYEQQSCKMHHPRTSGGCRPTWAMVSISDPANQINILNERYPLIFIFYQSKRGIIRCKT